MSNSLDPHQDRHSVGPDLGPNRLQRLSADDKSPIARKDLSSHCIVSTHFLRGNLFHLCLIKD